MAASQAAQKAILKYRIESREGAMETEMVRSAGTTPIPFCGDERSVGRSEAELVAKAKAGSRAAFGQLVECYGDRVFRMAQNILRSREDAEDVIQRCFQKAFVHVRRFEGRSSFSTWLTRIALNEALMLKRRGRKFRDVSLDAPSDNDDARLPLEIVDARPNPEHACFQKERQRLLFAAMKELKPRIRMALQFCELNEWSVRETARILGVSAGAVKSRVSRGRRELRERMMQGLAKQAGRGGGAGYSSGARRNRKFRFAS
jgi:RNA polymerase sigma-70 factor, ECF subfamily